MRFCIVCKQEIELERSEAIQATRLCTQHAKEIQQFGGEFTISATQERTSKPGSLKLNYGGIATQSNRNEEGLRRLLDLYERQQFEE